MVNMVHLVKKINIKMVNIFTKVNTFNVRLPKKYEEFESTFLKGLSVTSISARLTPRLTLRLTLQH